MFQRGGVNDVVDLAGCEIEPAFRWWQRESYLARGAKTVRDGFRFASDTNEDWLDAPRLLRLLEEAGA